MPPITLGHNNLGYPQPARTVKYYNDYSTSINNYEIRLFPSEYYPESKGFSCVLLRPKDTTKLAKSWSLNIVILSYF